MACSRVTFTFTVRSQSFSGLYITCLFKIQSLETKLAQDVTEDVFILEDGTDMLSRNVGNYSLTLLDLSVDGSVDMKLFW